MPNEAHTALLNLEVSHSLVGKFFLKSLQKAFGTRQVFSCEHCKFFKNSSFHKRTAVAVFGYSDLSKIFREITASKFQGQYAAQFTVCRYEGLCPATKTEIYTGVSKGIFQNFRTDSFENNFGR